MNRIVASLAAVLLSVVLVACGGSGAEPDAPADGAPATLILDFQPNAVHSGIYAAVADGDVAAQGVDLEVQVPGASTDAPKLLAAGRADLAVMDIQDLAIAREQGADLVGVGGLVQKPLAAVIAGDEDAVRTPADLSDGTVGVTGLPSDDAVLAAVMDSVGAEVPETVDIGFDSVAALSAGRVDAATAFWNVEGVALRQAGVATREFRVDDYGAPKFPELVIVTTQEHLDSDRELIAGAVNGLIDGYTTAARDPDTALAAEEEAVPELDPEVLEAQMDALNGAFAPALFLNRPDLEEWADYAVDYGIVEEEPVLDATFDFSLSGSGG